MNEQNNKIVEPLMILQEVLKKTTNFESYDIEECTPPPIVDSLYDTSPEFVEWQLAMLEQCTKIAVSMAEEFLEKRPPKMKYIEKTKSNISKYLDCVVRDYPSTLNEHQELYDYPSEENNE